MAQLNIVLTPEFEQHLSLLMRTRGIQSKSEAIRLAVAEAARVTGPADRSGFAEILGMGLRAQLNPRPKFASEDDLWS